MNNKIAISIFTLFFASLSFAQTKCYEFFHENGNPRSIEYYNAKGERIGTWKYYYENKQLLKKEKYKNNYIKGKVIVYYKNGKINKKIKYSKKGQQRTEKSYSLTGNLISINQFYKYQKEGTHTSYFSNGKVKSVNNYHKDKLNGQSKVYYDNGKVRFTKNYKNGKAIGIQTYYYDNGVVNAIYEYGENDKLLNVLEMNDFNGTPLEIGSLKDGNGIYYEYNYTGKRTRTYEVNEGVRRYKRD